MLKALYLTCTRTGLTLTLLGQMLSLCMRDEEDCYCLFVIAAALFISGFLLLALV